MGICSLARSLGAVLVMLPMLLLQASLLLQWPLSALAMRPDRLTELRKETVSMFYHGYKNYMEHAFPEDEVGQDLGPLHLPSADPYEL